MSFSEKDILKWVGVIILIAAALVILFVSLVLTSLETTKRNNNEAILRNVPIKYVKEIGNGEKILKVYNVPDSKIGPDDWRYFIKEIRNRLWETLAKTQKGKADVYLIVADKKMGETIKLIQENKEEKLITRSFEETIENLKESKEAILMEKRKDVDVFLMDQRINETGLIYEDIVKSFNHRSEKMDKIIKDLEVWNKKNNER